MLSRANVVYNKIWFGKCCLEQMLRTNVVKTNVVKNKCCSEKIMF